MKKNHFLVNYEINKEEDEFMERTIEQLACVFIKNINFFKSNNGKKRTTEMILTVAALFFRDCFISAMTYSGTTDQEEATEQFKEISSVINGEIKKIMILNSKKEDTA